MKSTPTPPHSSLLLRRTNFLPLLSISTPSPSPSPPPRFFFFSRLHCNSSNHPPPLTTLNIKLGNLISAKQQDDVAIDNFGVQLITKPLPPAYPRRRLSLSDQAFFLLTFIACTASIAFTGFVMAAVPTLYDYAKERQNYSLLQRTSRTPLAMGRAAISFAKLADTAREELPSTMAAIRLSGMEISDLTLELSDLRK
ncbi:hypothetical protein OSB04_016804 [Centaurea solstitialis]|uniref:Uncharacterized protein n=1 Tax=Centaurea solstitialis TaxID=347529 RepID=A0AA38T3B8_9ASTR|nr:hypothetical protein OSB04_016804 [Centaurea solstitialis]